MNAVLMPMRADAGRSARYARCVLGSRQAEWQIDRDLFRGREFDHGRRFLPDSLTFADRLGFLHEDEARLLSHVQGRTYAYLFSLAERFISAKMLEQTRGHLLGDQHALEGLVRFSNEELKHQEMFRRVESMIQARMPSGYIQVADANQVAQLVLGKSTWSVLALMCSMELAAQAHYEQSIAPRNEICPLFRDVFRFHWRDECQHVMLDELEWTAEHERLSRVARDAAVHDLIALISALDEILIEQAKADTDAFLHMIGRRLTAQCEEQLAATVLAAYRWQYIVAGVQHPYFTRLLTSMTTPPQMARIRVALAPMTPSAEAA